MKYCAKQLRVSDLTEANKMLKELKDIQPTINFRKMQGGIKKLQVWTYSDASLNIMTGRRYGQTGVITSIMVFGKGGECILHVVEWNRSKQIRVRHSSYGAEILAF